jgi:hypothetical protein
MPEPGDLIPGAETAMAPQPFDIGPSYEEELRTRNQEKQQRESAILMEIFQDNLRMREQVRQFEAEAV